MSSASSEEIQPIIEWARRIRADALADREAYAEERVKQEREEIAADLEGQRDQAPEVRKIAYEIACRRIRSRGAAPAEAKRPCARCGWPYCQDEAWSQCPNCDAKPGPTPKHIEPIDTRSLHTVDTIILAAKYNELAAAVNRMQETP